MLQWILNFKIHTNIVMHISLEYTVDGRASASNCVCLYVYVLLRT